jgi:hypothetical protein
MPNLRPLASLRAVLLSMLGIWIGALRIAP